MLTFFYFADNLKQGFLEYDCICDKISTRMNITGNMKGNSGDDIMFFDLF